MYYTIRGWSNLGLWNRGHRALVRGRAHLRVLCPGGPGATPADTDRDCIPLLQDEPVMSKRGPGNRPPGRCHALFYKQPNVCISWADPFPCWLEGPPQEYANREAVGGCEVSVAAHWLGRRPVSGEPPRLPRECACLATVVCAHEMRVSAG